MCNSQAEGGQRCYGHAKTALETAETKYDALVTEAATYLDTGRTIPPELRAKGMRAACDREDALARYASTTQGAADLAARMDALTVDGKVPSYRPGSRANETYHDYAEALSAGARMRARAKDIHDAVKAGTMTSEQATALTQTQADRAAQWRQHRARVNAGPAVTAPPTMESSRTALKAATDATIASTAKEVKAAVTLIAATVHAKYPNAKRVELEGSDQGDWLSVVSVDGDDEKVDELESGDDSSADDLSWASSCIYDAHRTTAPALHSANDRPIERTDNLYIDINEALKA